MFLEHTYSIESLIGADSIYEIQCKVHEKPTQVKIEQYLYYYTQRIESHVTIYWSDIIQYSVDFYSSGLRSSISAVKIALVNPFFTIYISYNSAKVSKHLVLISFLPHFALKWKPRTFWEGPVELSGFFYLRSDF